MKVVVLGYGQMMTNIIAGCLDAGADVVGVFRYDRVKHPFLDRFILDVFNPSKDLSYIKSLNLYEINARSANSAEYKKEILKLNPDIVFVATWGEKLKKPMINLPKIATINVHPSLLPKYRGPNPYLQAVKHQESKSGVTFHIMDENFDTGPILQQNAVEIAPSDTGEELRQKIVLEARKGVRELIKRLEEDLIIPLNQDETKSSYFPQIFEDEVMLDFSKPANEVAAHIRAFYPWHKCYFSHQGKFFYPDPYNIEVIENKALAHTYGTIIDKSSKDASISVICSDNKVLKMGNLKLYGFLNKFWTKQYIKTKVKINQNIS